VTVDIRLEPLRVTLHIAKSLLKVGARTQAVVRANNDGGTRIVGVTALLMAQSQLVTIPIGSQSLGTLAPGATKLASWTVCATAVSTYTITAKVSGLASSGAVVDYDQATLRVSGSSRSRC
jgi:hypothetical protein